MHIVDSREYVAARQRWSETEWCIMCLLGNERRLYVCRRYVSCESRAICFIRVVVTRAYFRSSVPSTTRHGMALHANTHTHYRGTGTKGRILYPLKLLTAFEYIFQIFR